MLGNYNVTLVNGTLTVDPYAFMYTISDDSQTYGTPANLASDLGTVIARVNGQKLGISYSSTGDTARPTPGLMLTGEVSDGTGLASNYNVTLSTGP